MPPSRYNTSCGHLRQLADAEKKGVESAGGTADICRIASSQNDDTIAEEKEDPDIEVPIAGPDEVTQYDAILFGLAIPHGASTSTEWRAFWDRTGRQWAQKEYHRKLTGVFLSSSTPGSALEQSMPILVSPLVHHGIRYIPLGHKYSATILEDMSEVHGGSAWGAGTFMGPDGKRQPSKLELELAEIQGRSFYEALANIRLPSTAHESSLEHPDLKRKLQN